jgi:ParB-like chromosome segregation protein Spo0J
MVKQVPIDWVSINKDNPRFIRDEKFTKLVKSLREFPDMAQLRPLIVNAEMVVLGGNMRLKAMQMLNWETVPVIVAENLTREQQAEFIIKDNVGFGEWNWEMLANQWDADLITDWGLDIPGFDGELPEDSPEDSDPNALLVEGTPEQLEDLLTELNTRGFKVKFK